MKQFFGAFFGSIIGLVVASIIGVFVLVAVLKASFGSALNEKETVLKENSVLKMDLEGMIMDRADENPLHHLGKSLSGDEDESDGLNTILAKLKQAAGDNKIKGLLLHFKGLHTGMATSQELRDAISAFRKSGKFVYAYGENLTGTEYFLASSADKVFVNPQGDVEWKGLGVQMMFFKNTLEKLDIDVRVFRHGQFKSAVEPFILDKMSQANRIQAHSYIGSIWNNMTEAVASSRKLSTQELQNIANDINMQFPEKMEGKLIDRLAYEDEVISEIRKKIGVSDTATYKLTDLSKYKLKPKSGAKLSHIAVIYATGSINSGKGGDDEIGSERIAAAIREARLDKKVKAIVMRVNSPGGSALASEVIWREVTLARKAKPFVVSMGNVAASGGYYIACAADRIFAEPNTITGSIGVFGLLPEFSKMLKNKLGVTIDTINTNKYSDVGSALREIRKEEGEYIQASVEKVYSTFLMRVAEGRNISVAEVDSIGQGRVWSGSEALRIKLVDELGGLESAIAYAAKKAGVTDYKLMDLPKQKNPFEAILGNSEEVQERVIRQQVGNAYPYLKYARQVMTMEGPQARLPYEIIWQ